MIIFLNGSINSGKSTVSKIIAKELQNTAVLEIDKLREMINWMPIEQAVPISLENAVSLIKNFVIHDLHVIIPYPLSKKNYEYMISNLKDVSTKMYFFTLAPNLEKVLTNRGNRELNEWEVERIKYHYDIGIHSPDFGEIINNSEQLPEETVKYIISKLT